MDTATRVAGDSSHRDRERSVTRPMLPPPNSAGTDVTSATIGASQNLIQLLPREEGPLGTNNSAPDLAALDLNSQAAKARKQIETGFTLIRSQERALTFRNLISTGSEALDNVRRSGRTWATMLFDQALVSGTSFFTTILIARSFGKEQLGCTF